MIENPQPVWLPFLLLAVPGIALSAYALNRALFPPEDRPLCTIAAIAIVLGLLPTHILALASGSLSFGVAAAWSILGAGGYLWIARHWRDFSAVRSSAHAERWWRRPAIAALTTFLILPTTLLANVSDEANFNGHDAIIAHLQNGVYPPRYLYDPSLPLRYHYAFDLAGAIVTGLLRLRLDQAIDLLGLALWPCMFLLLWRVGEHVGGRRAGLFVALTVCFAGGWPLLAWSGACGLCASNGLRINPPFINYYFQPPWSLGVPLFCLAVLQWAALPRLHNRMLGLAMLVGSLVMLSLTEAVLFVTSIAALGVTEAWRVIRRSDRTARMVLIALPAALLGAKLSGGFFVSGPFPPAGGMFGSGFSLHDFSGQNAFLGQVQWDLASFGALLFLGFFGLLQARQAKDFLLILTLLSLITVNALRYQHSWDIVKFGTVGFITLAIGSGIALSDLVGWVGRRGWRTIYALIILGVAGQGVPYPFLLLYANYYEKGREPFSMQMIRPYFSRSYPVDTDDARAVNFLRIDMGPSEILYRTEKKSEPYAIWGGLPTQASVYVENGSDNDQYGLGEGKLEARRDLARISPDWFDRLLTEHVTWLVADSDDVAINAILDCPEGRQRAVFAAEYGKIRIYHLKY
jgi:hypothetical protein